MFYNISKEKQNNLIQAAIKELTNKDYSSVSILSIAKEAGISRGTFYNYFNSVGDLFEYIIDQVRQERYEYLPGIFEENNKNLLQTIAALFIYDYDAFLEARKYSLIRNYLKYIRVEHKSFKELFLLKVLSPLLDQFHMTTLNQYNVTDEEFYYTIEMLGLLLSDLLIQAEHQEIRKEEVIQKIQYIITLLETGLNNIKR